MFSCCNSVLFPWQWWKSLKKTFWSPPNLYIMISRGYKKWVVVNGRADALQVALALRVRVRVMATPLVHPSTLLYPETQSTRTHIVFDDRSLNTVWQPIDQSYKWAACACVCVHVMVYESCVLCRFTFSFTQSGAGVKVVGGMASTLLHGEDDEGDTHVFLLLRKVGPYWGHKTAALGQWGTVAISNGPRAVFPSQWTWFGWVGTQAERQRIVLLII